MSTHLVVNILTRKFAAQFKKKIKVKCNWKFTQISDFLITTCVSLRKTIEWTLITWHHWTFGHKIVRNWNCNYLSKIWNTLIKVTIKVPVLKQMITQLAYQSSTQLNQLLIRFTRKNQCVRENCETPPTVFTIFRKVFHVVSSCTRENFLVLKTCSEKSVTIQETSESRWLNYFIQPQMMIYNWFISTLHLQYLESSWTHNIYFVELKLVANSQWNHHYEFIFAVAKIN